MRSNKPKGILHVSHQPVGAVSPLSGVTAPASGCSGAGDADAGGEVLLAVGKRARGQEDAEAKSVQPMKQRMRFPRENWRRLSERAATPRARPGIFRHAFSAVPPQFAVEGRLLTLSR